MKLIYSHLQKFLPDLHVPPQQLRDDLTLIGHFTNYYEEIDNEIVFDLDIKVNRGDCLGYYGLARDLSIFYNLQLNTISNFQFPSSDNYLPIKIDSDKVTRVMSVKITNLKNKTSPEWLKKFLKLHQLKSINALVDLTNYAMFMFGIPNHAFDTAKSGEKLTWQMNPGFQQFTSLDGTTLKLDQNILMINNANQPLSLSFWGGKACAIEESTTDTIIEMAIYNSTTVRQNSRQLKAVTEASVRLEKSLDPELVPLAFNYLVELIIDTCGGRIDSQVFDYYPHPINKNTIKFNPKLPSIMSGIDIPEKFALDIVQRVGNRPDLTLEEDLVEEVVRFYGYNKIPIDQPLPFKEVADITPENIYLIACLKDKLTEMGYDEILSWPLVSQPSDLKTVVKTQNSVNSESIYLRQSLIPSLLSQLDQYQRFKLPQPQFFEIGRVFYQENNQYKEHDSLCLYHYDFNQLQKDVLSITLNNNIEFNGNFAEINLDNLVKPTKYIPKNIDNNAIELTSQIITLDANVTIENGEPLQLIKQYSAKIDPKILWSMEIIDIYQNRYTFRVCYYNCDDKIAKKAHLKTFNLI